MKVQDLRIVYHRDMGFAVEEKMGGFWQQISNWYTTEARLRRYFLDKIIHPAFTYTMKPVVIIR